MLRLTLLPRITFRNCCRVAALLICLPETTLVVQVEEALEANLAAHSALYLVHSPQNTIQSKINNSLIFESHIKVSFLKKKYYIYYFVTCVKCGWFNGYLYPPPPPWDVRSIRVRKEGFKSTELTSDRVL